MNMPIIGPLHERLKALVGNWAGEETLFPSPWGPGGTARGSWRFAFDASGFNLIHDYNEERSNGQHFDAHGVLAVDPEAAEYVWFWFDSFGFPPLNPARGNWDGSTLMLIRHTPRGIGRSFFELAGDRFTYRIDSKVKGQDDFAPVMEGTFLRT